MPRVCQDARADQRRGASRGAGCGHIPIIRKSARDHQLGAPWPAFQILASRVPIRRSLLIRAGDSRVNRAVGGGVVLAGGVGGILDADRPRAAVGVGGAGVTGRAGGAHRSAARGLLTRRVWLAPARPAETTERSGAGREAGTGEAHLTARAGLPGAAELERPERVAVAVVVIVVVIV